MDWELVLGASIYLTLFGLFWGALWLILASGHFDESPHVRRMLDAARAFLAPWPLLWLVAYGALLVRAWLAAGEWPRLHPFTFAEGWTANIHASEFPLHLMLLDALRDAAFAAALLFVPFHAAIRIRTLRSQALLALFAVSFTAYIWVFVTEGPANGLNWVSYTRW